MKLIILFLLSVSIQISAKEAVPVIAYKVTKTVDDLSFIAIGYAKAYQSINIQMPTNGIIKKLPYQAGDVVKKGDVIVYQYADILKIQKKRDQLLINKNASKSKKKNAKNYAFQDAILQLAQTKLLIKQKQFKAPFNGVLGQLTVSEGALITSQNIISTLDNVSQIRVGFEVSEAKAARLKKGTTIKIFTKQTKQLINTGVVTYIDSHFNKKTRSIKVEGIIENTKGSIKPGIFLDVEVVVENNKPNIYILSTAIKNVAGDKFIFIIKNNKLVMTKVKVGKRKAKQIQILTGLQGNELIVARGLIQLENLIDVEVIDYLDRQ